ncbi:MAG: hypothetical protein DWQ19_11330 [Crenarchaeota archaeon]|nr:MAG: hypothetical protein DWQ19_11330 [Thermoproteota archaeon]
MGLLLESDPFDPTDVDNNAVCGYPLVVVGNSVTGDLFYVLEIDSKSVDDISDDITPQKLTFKNIEEEKVKMKSQLEPLGLWKEENFGLWLTSNVD